MFEKALVTRIGDSGVNLGLLAETVLFYNSTQLLLNDGAVVELAKRLPPDDLLAFLDRGEVKLSFLRPFYSVLSNGPVGAFKFAAATLHLQKPDGKPPPKRLAQLNLQAEIEERLLRALDRSASTRKLAKEIAERLSPHTFKGVSRGENVIVDLAHRDIADPGFLREAARIVLEQLLPPSAVPANFTFNLVVFGDSYIIDTDLDFGMLNQFYHQRVSPSHSTINDKYILAHIVSSRADSYFAAEYMAEIVTTPVNSKIMRLKHYDLLRARDKNLERLDHFKEMTCPHFPSITEAINSGERTVSEFLKLLDEAQKFRAWLHHANPDREIVASYIKAATEKTWADKLPTKTTRWAMATHAYLFSSGSHRLS